MIEGQVDKLINNANIKEKALVQGHVGVSSLKKATLMALTLGELLSDQHMDG